MRYWLIPFVLVTFSFLSPAYAGPPAEGPSGATCVDPVGLDKLVTDQGATTWLINGVHAVQFLWIINHINPPTNYRADTVLLVSPGGGDKAALVLFNEGCADPEHIPLDARIVIKTMREVFGVWPGEFGLMLVHDQWVNGDPVPLWVRSQCCGPEDVHHLTLDQVHLLPDGFHVDGLKDPIPASKLLPSPDNEWWIFYRRFPDGSTSSVYCFFGPFSGT